MWLLSILLCICFYKGERHKGACGNWTAHDVRQISGSKYSLRRHSEGAEYLLGKEKIVFPQVN